QIAGRMKVVGILSAAKAPSKLPAARPKRNVEVRPCLGIAATSSITARRMRNWVRMSAKEIRFRRLLAPSPITGISVASSSRRSQSRIAIPLLRPGSMARMVIVAIPLCRCLVATTGRALAELLRLKRLYIFKAIDDATTELDELRAFARPAPALQCAV